MVFSFFLKSGFVKIKKKESLHIRIKRKVVWSEVSPNAAFVYFTPVVHNSLQQIPFKLNLELMLEFSKEKLTKVHFNKKIRNGVNYASTLQ